MYHASDKKSAIKEIQRYLFKLSDTTYPQIPRIPIDGVYDGETAAAVKKYQELRSFKETGIVDYQTFTEMSADYFFVVSDEKMRDFIIGETDFPLSVGSYSEDVRTLHIIINELAKSFSGIEKVGVGAYYSEKTANAVNSFSKIFGYPATGTVDKRLFSRLNTELEAIRAQGKNTV